MAVAVIEATNAGDIIRYGILPFATIHDAANGDSAQNGTVWYIAQLHYADDWIEVQRAGLEFDLSPYAGKGISAATISIYGYAQAGPRPPYDNDFTITLVDGSDLAASLVVADYGDLLNDTTSYGGAAGSGFLLEDWLVITLNAAGLVALNAAVGSGVVRFGVRSSKDISNTPPPGGGGSDGGHSIGFYGLGTAGKKPKLTITYGSSEGSGIVAVVQTRFHYLDAYGVERFIEGTVVV